MKLRNLSSEYPSMYSEYIRISMGPTRRKISEGDIDDVFIEKWRKGDATLSDWLKAHPNDIIAAEQSIDPDLKQTVDRKKENLYDWYLEFRVQNDHMKDLKAVLKFSPWQVQSFAKKELQDVERFLQGNMDKYLLDRYYIERRLNKDVNYGSLLKEIKDPEYSSPQDLLNNSGYPEAEALSRYMIYLEEIISEGLEGDEVANSDPEEFTFENLWPDIQILSRDLTVSYSSRQHYYEETNYVDYEIRAVSGCYSGSTLKGKLISLFKSGFDALLTKLQTLPAEDRLAILEDLKYEAEELKSTLADGEYIEEESEYGPRKVHHFRRFNSLKYKGDNDLRFS